MKKPNRTKSMTHRGQNVTGMHLDKTTYGRSVVRRLLPSIVAEPVIKPEKVDRRRKKCAVTECTAPHLKGSDYCREHDNGERPKTRKSD
jgi:hypothetical protein